MPEYRLISEHEERDQNESFHFDEIPEKRTNLPFALFGLLSVICLIPTIVWKGVPDIGTSIFLTSCGIIIVATVRQLFFLVVDCFSLKERHKGSLRNALHYNFAAWKIMYGIPGCFLISSLLTALQNREIVQSDLQTKWHTYLLDAIIVGLLTWDQNETDRRQRAEKVKINVGEGLAWHYFLGYLKLISNPPVECTLYDGGIKRNLDLKKRIEQYEMKEDVGIKIKKMFILMPSSCMVHETLGAGLDPDLFVAKELDNLVISRAGTENRVYKNSVYKVKTNSGGHYFCVAEAASPCLVLKDIAEQKGLSKEEMQEQMVIFYNRLGELISNDKDCCNYFKLVYYNDSEEEELKLSKILTHAIEQEAILHGRSAA